MESIGELDQAGQAEEALAGHDAAFASPSGATGDGWPYTLKQFFI